MPFCGVIGNAHAHPARDREIAEFDPRLRASFYPSGCSIVFNFFQGSFNAYALTFSYELTMGTQLWVQNMGTNYG